MDHGRRRTADGRLAVRILTTEAELGRLEGLGHPIERLPSPRIEDDGSYSSPAEGDAQLRTFVASSPRAGLVQLGQSVEGRPILAAWFGQAPSSGAPDVRVLGAHHGDEWSSFEVALDTAELLATADGSRAEVTALLDARTVWVAPYINPDGVAYRSRQNANDVDLNRNFDYQWSDGAWLSGEAPFSEPETRAVRAHALATVPALSLSLHSGAANVGYVWNYSTTPVPERAELLALAESYAASCTIADFWVTNGAEWYRSWGDTNDWSYGRYGGMDFTVEVTVDKIPPSSEIGAFVAGHREAVLAFLTAPIALEGQVTDAASGRPIPATVELVGATDSRPFLTDLDGRFARHAELAGAELRIRAPGYTALTATPGEALALAPASLATATASPSRVASGTLVELLGASDGEAVLSQPGHADAAVAISGERFTAPELAAGAWTLTDAGGQVFPRALLVEGGGPAMRTGAVQDERRFTLSGTGFAEGSRTWAVLGEERALVELALLSETGQGLVADAADIPPDSDFLTLTNGTWLVHTPHTEGPEPRDTGLPADSGDSDSGGTGLVGSDTADSGEEPVRPACGCATGSLPLGGAGAIWLGLLPLVARRRRHR